MSVTPWPLQFLQVAGRVPRLAPLPLQSGHVSCRGIVIVLVAVTGALWSTRLTTVTLTRRCPRLRSSLEPCALSVNVIEVLPGMFPTAGDHTKAVVALPVPVWSTGRITNPVAVA